MKNSILISKMSKIEDILLNLANSRVYKQPQGSDAWLKARSWRVGGSEIYKVASLTSSNVRSIFNSTLLSKILGQVDDTKTDFVKSEFGSELHLNLSKELLNEVLFHYQGSDVDPETIVKSQNNAISKYILAEDYCNKYMIKRVKDNLSSFITTFTGWVRPLEHGKIFEPVARDMFLKHYYENRTYDEIGGIYNPDCPSFCHSPDGVVQLDDGTLALLEFKCPISRTIKAGEYGSDDYKYQVWSGAKLAAPGAFSKTAYYECTIKPRDESVPVDSSKIIGCVVLQINIPRVCMTDVLMVDNDQYSVYKTSHLANLVDVPLFGWKYCGNFTSSEDAISAIDLTESDNNKKKIFIIHPWVFETDNLIIEDVESSNTFKGINVDEVKDSVTRAMNAVSDVANAISENRDHIVERLFLQILENGSCIDLVLEYFKSVYTFSSKKKVVAAAESTRTVLFTS